MMESFKLNQEDRDKLFFNKYKYRASCQLEGVRYTYYCSSIEDYHKKIKRNKLEPWGGKKDYSSIDYDRIEKFIDWRNENKKDLIIRIEYDTFSVFSNDLESLKTLVEIGDVQFTEAKVVAPGVKFFKEKPDYNYRIYLKGVKLDGDRADQICSFVDNYKDRPNINISKALVNAVSCGKIRSKRWIHNSYYIDYTEESMLSILRLVFPGVLSSKIYKLDSVSNKHKYSEKMEYLNGENS
jgi:hypothetical protein